MSCSSMTDMERGEAYPSALWSARTVSFSPWVMNSRIFWRTICSLVESFSIIRVEWKDKRVKRILIFERNEELRDRRAHNPKTVLSYIQCIHIDIFIFFLNANIFHRKYIDKVKNTYRCVYYKKYSKCSSIFRFLMFPIIVFLESFCCSGSYPLAMAGWTLIEELSNFFPYLLWLKLDSIHNLVTVTTIKGNISAFRIEIVLTLLPKRRHVHEIEIGCRHDCKLKVKS